MAGRGLNKVSLIGNLGADPEVRNIDSGAKVATFSLATNESYKDKNTGETHEMTEWHRVVLWRGLADIAEKFLKKGSQVYVEGKLRTRQFQDKDNNTRYITEVEVRDMVLLGGKTDGGGSIPPPQDEPDERSGGQTSTQGGGAMVNDGGEDDLPF